MTTKVQLVSNIIGNVSGGASFTGIVTASSAVIGTAVTMNSLGLNVTGVITATSFIGNGSGLTGAGSTVADDTTTNATFYPVFTQTTSGTITASKVSTSKLSFNPSTGTLTATKFSGDGSGLTGAGSTVADDTTTNQNFYPVFTQTTTGTITASKVSTSKLSFNPSTGTLNATTFFGSLTGIASTASNVTVTTSSTSSAFKVPFVNTTANTTGNYNLLQDSGSTFTYNPSSDTLTVGTLTATAGTLGSNGTGTRTVSTGTPTGGSDGDIWYKY